MNNHLKDLLLIKVQALYDMETQIVKAVPTLIKAATDSDLQEALQSHLEETENHVTRLEQAFEILGEKPKKLKAEAIRGLADDANWVIKQKMPPAATDAALIGAASYVEHYEIAGYTAAKRWAEELGESELVDLLQATLEEEQSSDEKLATLAEESIDTKVNDTQDDTEADDEDM